MKPQIIKSVLGTMPMNIRSTSNSTKDYCVPWHIHDELEILRVTKGSFLFEVNKAKYTLQAGDIVFVQPRVPHSTTNLLEGTDTQVIQFPLDYFSNEKVPEVCKYLSKLVHADKAPFAVFFADTKANQELSACYDTIICENQLRKPGYEMYIKSAAYAMLAFFTRYNMLTDSSSIYQQQLRAVDKIGPALAYIHENYPLPISLQEVSEVVRMNPSYFGRLFK